MEYVIYLVEGEINYLPYGVGTNSHFGLGLAIA